MCGVSGLVVASGGHSVVTLHRIEVHLDVVQLALDDREPERNLMVHIKEGDIIRSIAPQFETRNAPSGAYQAGILS